MGAVRGRDPELRALAETLDAPVHGRGAALLIEGSAGLGKSRLLAEARARAATLRLSVAAGGPAPGRTGVPLGPLLAALFEGDAPLLDRDHLNALREAPDYWLLQEVQELLERRAALAPLLVVLDDLHWADEATVAAIGTLITRLAGDPIAWIGAYRPREAPTSLFRTVHQLQTQGARKLVLAPLADAAVRRIVEDVLGADPGPGVLELAASAHGNPFLLMELLHGLEEDGLLGLAEPRLPTRVRDSMRQRLDRLHPVARRAAIAGAVIGRHVRFDHLLAMLDIEATALLEGLDELVRADILVPGEPELRFRHDLVRQAVLDAVPAAARRALDRQAADVLLATGAPPEEIAARLLRTAEPGDLTAVGTLRAAAGAIGTSDPGAACDLTLKALALAPPDAPERLALKREAALLLNLAGRAAEARAFAAEVLGDSVTAAEQAEVEFAVARMFTLPPAVRVEAGQRALALADLPEPLRAVHACLLVLNLVADGSAAAAHVAAAEAEPLAGADPAAVLLLEIGRLALDQVDGRYGTVLARVESFGALGSSPHDRTMYNAVEYFRTSALVSLNRNDEALERILGQLEGIRRDKLASMEPRWELDRGRCLFQAGRLADARAALEGVLLDGVIASPLPIPPDAAGLLALARIATHTGNADHAERCAQIALETLAADRSDSRRHLTWLLALQALARQDAQGVRAALELQGELAQESVLPLLALDTCDPPQLVRAALCAGDPALAAWAVEAAERRSALNPGEPQLAAVAAHARGLRDGDAHALAAAVEGLAGGTRPLALASALEDLGCAPIAREERVAALSDALTRYVRCGATWDERRVRRRLRALGVRRRVTAERPSSGWTALTASELEVAELVAQGLTNREAAQRLFVSPHTVSTHLRHVFAKLGISSRVELTRLVLERAGA